MANKTLIVIGGGAAGFFCAINAAMANPNLQITILEKTNKILSKVKVSGGGRCNVTHSCFDIATLSQQYPRGSTFVKKAFHQFNTNHTIAWFAKYGVTLHTESDGRMFPTTNDSQTIIDCLLLQASKNKVVIKTNYAIEKIEKKDTIFYLTTKNQEILTADYVCIATGGFPKLEQFDFIKNVKEMNGSNGLNVSKESNESKESSGSNGSNESKESNGSNELKESNGSSGSNGSKESNESNELSGLSGSNESNESKESKESSGSNGSKESNESSESNGSNELNVSKVSSGSNGAEESNESNTLTTNIDAPVPSLFTFNMPNHSITLLMGISVPHAMVKIKGTKYAFGGPILITHWGLSGPAVLKLSSFAAVALAAMQYNFTILINWVPSYNQTSLQQHWLTLISNNKQTVANHNPLQLPNRLWLYFLALANIPTTNKWTDVPNQKQNILLQLLTNMECEVKGKTTFKEEFVTAGGVNLAQIDYNTMQNKQIENLYYAGEVLNIDGITGGFNFQNAWTTGWVAANAIGNMK